MRFDQYSDRLIWSCIGILSFTALVAQIALLERRPSVQVERERPLMLTAPSKVADEWMGVAIDVLDWIDVTAKDRGAPPAQLQPSITDLFVEAVIQIESGGRPDVVGKAGERGLMQIKKETWREVTEILFGRPVRFSRAFEPELNRQVGQAYLRMLCSFLYENQADWKSDMRSLLLASYNAGPTHVREVGFDLRQLPASTQDYVERAMALHDFFLTDAPELTAWVQDEPPADVF